MKQKGEISTVGMRRQKKNQKKKKTYQLAPNER
jgi:hypothetical protein